MQTIRIPRSSEFEFLIFHFRVIGSQTESESDDCLLDSNY